MSQSTTGVAVEVAAPPSAPAALALAPSVRMAYSLEPRNFEEALRLADILADSEMVPKDFRGKPGNCMVAIQWGAEIGLKPLQALQGIAVINGRPSLWGDSMLALVRSSPLCEYVVETHDGDKAVCRVKRRGEPEQTREFSQADAVTAGLAGKEGPWRTNPKRMRQMRARAFALRDVFTDVLKGIPMAEEAMDFTENLAPAAPIIIAEAPRAEPEILLGARAAADKGREAFALWWKMATRDQRHALRDHMGDFERRVTEADKKRTVDAATSQPATQPATPAAANAPAAGSEPEGAAADDPWLADLKRGETAGGAA